MDWAKIIVSFIKAILESITKYFDADNRIKLEKLKLNKEIEKYVSQADSLEGRIKDEKDFEERRKLENELGNTLIFIHRLRNQLSGLAK